MQRTRRRAHKEPAMSAAEYQALVSKKVMSAGEYRALWAPVQDKNVHPASRKEWQRLRQSLRKQARSPRKRR